MNDDATFYSTFRYRIFLLSFSHKAKWDKENKLWYITKSVYNKNKTYIDEFIGYKIIWNNCCHCNGTGYFAGDDCWFC